MPKGILPICRMVLKMWGFLGRIDDFEGIIFSLCCGALHAAHGCIQHTSALYLVSLDRCTLSLVACEIWQCVVHPGFEIKRNSLQKIGVGNRKASKKGQKLSNRTPVLFHIPLFSSPRSKFLRVRSNPLSWWGREATIQIEICFNVRVKVTLWYISYFDDFISFPLREKHRPSVFVMRTFCWKVTTGTNRKVWLYLFYVSTCSFEYYLLFKWKPTTWKQGAGHPVKEISCMNAKLRLFKCRHFWPGLGRWDTKSDW
jgi:hypothetical protein